jgi:hypothetical protein
MAANTNQNSALPLHMDAVDEAILTAAGIRPAAAAPEAAAPEAAAPAPAGGKAGGKAPAASKSKGDRPNPIAKASGKKKAPLPDAAGIQAMIDAAVRTAERETRARVESEMAAKAREAQRVAVERAQIEILKGQLADANGEIAKYQSLVVRLAKSDQSGIVEATKAAIFSRHERLFGQEEDPERADYEETVAKSSPRKRLREPHEERPATDEIPAHDKSQDEEEEEHTKKKRQRDPAAPKMPLKAVKMWVAENMRKVYTGKDQENVEDPKLRADFIEKTNWNGNYPPNKEKVNEDGSAVPASPGCMALLGAYYKHHLTDEDREPYEQREAEDKERFEREMKAYKAQKTK